MNLTDIKGITDTSFHTQITSYVRQLKEAKEYIDRERSELSKQLQRIDTKLEEAERILEMLKPLKLSR